jgi:hypothetical protein
MDAMKLISAGKRAFAFVTDLPLKHSSENTSTPMAISARANIS